MISLQLHRSSPSPRSSSEKGIFPLLPVELWQHIFGYLTYPHPLKHVITFGQATKETRGLCLLCSQLFHCYLGRYAVLQKNIEVKCVLERKKDLLKCHPFQRNSLKFYTTDSQNNIYLSNEKQNHAQVEIIRKCDKCLISNQNISKFFEIFSLNVFKSLIENKSKISYLIENTTPTCSNSLGIFPEDSAHLSNDLIKEWVKKIIACHPIENGFIVVTNFGFGFWKYLEEQLHLEAFFCLYKQCFEFPSGFYSVVYPVISSSVLHNDCLIISERNWSYGSSISWIITTLSILPWLKCKAPPSLIDRQRFSETTALKKTGTFLYHEKGQKPVDTLISFKVEQQKAIWKERKLNNQQIKQFAKMLYQPSDWKKNTQEFHIKRTWNLWEMV